MAHDFQVLSSQLLLDAPIIAVRKDELAMPNEQVASREVVEHLGAVAVVAVNAAGEVAMSQLDKLIKQQSVEEKILIDVELSFK